MEHHFPLMKHFFILHVACLQVLSAESGMTPRMGWRRGADQTSGGWRPVSIPPEERPAYLFDAGATGEIDTDPLHQGFGGFSRKKAANRDRVVRYGRFNSDTYGCTGIQTRTCTSRPHCTGCFGLYTCNLALGKCQLKGLSRRTEQFLQTLRDF